MTTRRTRPVLDVAELPDQAFGSRDIMWWGTLGFIVIEGFTLVLCAAAWLYLRNRTGNWPPPGIPLPAIGVATAQVIAMLASIPLLMWTSRAAHAYHLQRTRLGLTIATGVALAFTILRVLELYALNVRWDTHAYGSAQWLLLCAHGTLLLFQVVEVGGLAAVFWVGALQKKHFSDAADLAFYWYFMVLAWVPLYVICFLLPRWA